MKLYEKGKSGGADRHLYFGGEEGSEAWFARPSDKRKPNM